MVVSMNVRVLSLVVVDGLYCSMILCDPSAGRVKSPENTSKVLTQCAVGDRFDTHSDPLLSLCTTKYSLTTRMWTNLI